MLPAANDGNEDCQDRGRAEVSPEREESSKYYHEGQSQAKKVRVGRVKHLAERKRRLVPASSPHPPNRPSAVPQGQAGNRRGGAIA
ncbi:hypothetical protein LIA77_08420 [Sarocladium implicatum]|jgi:hypothetical protein|nr:hypothetical protein LIA77_08420 [Sarocladium implicatum]